MNTSKPTGAGGAGDRDVQISTLIEFVDTLKRKLSRLELKINELAARVPAEAHGDEADPAGPAAWVWFTPPAAAENDPGNEDDPRFTVTNFVAWYNVTFVGVDGGRARPIPPCWPQHTGLAMEVAALAYSWRAANIRPTAAERDAQHWLHQWRPGFADRLTRDWVHPDCLDGDHRGAETTRANRFEVAEQAAHEATAAT